MEHLRRVIPLLLILLAPIWMTQAAGQRSSLGLQIGFSPFRLYDVDTNGIPVFMPNESVWVRAPAPIRVSLTSPTGRTASPLSVDKNPILLHTFSGLDPPGRWMLDAVARDLSETHSMEFRGLRLEGVEVSNAFRLDQETLVAEGNVKIPPEDVVGPHSLVLTRHPLPTTLNEVAGGSLVDGASLQIRVYGSSVDPGEVILEPYAPGLAPSEEGFEVPVSEIQAVVWAEARIDIPFVKSRDGVTSVVTVPGIVAKSRSSRVLISYEPDMRVELKIPPLAEASENGEVPSRLGRGQILFHTQIEDTIQITRIPVYYLPDGVAVSFVDEFRSQPTESSFSYVLRDNVTEASGYNFYIFSRARGAQVVWNTTITPTIGRVTVVNSATDTPITGYTMRLAGTRGGHVTLGSDTYVVVPPEGADLQLDLSIDGIRFREEEIVPSRLTLTPLARTTVRVPTGRVEFRVHDILGIPVEAGELLIYRKDGDNDEFQTQINWSQGRSPTLTMPLDTYFATVYALGASANATFPVGSPEMLVDVSVARLQITTEQAVVSAILTVLAGEAFIAYKGWKRFIIFRRKTTGTQSSSR